MPQTVIPQALMPQALMPQTVMPQSLMPQALIPQALMPQALIPQALMPQALMPQALIPQAVILSEAKNLPARSGLRPFPVPEPAYRKPVERSKGRTRASLPQAYRTIEGPCPEHSCHSEAGLPAEESALCSLFSPFPSHFFDRKHRFRAFSRRPSHILDRRQHFGPFSLCASYFLARAKHWSPSDRY